MVLNQISMKFKNDCFLLLEKKNYFAARTKSKEVIEARKVNINYIDDYFEEELRKIKWKY